MSTHGLAMLQQGSGRGRTSMDAARISRERISQRMYHMQQLTRSCSPEHAYRQLVHTWLRALQLECSQQTVQRIVYRLSNVPPIKAYVACCIADEAVSGLVSVSQGNFEHANNVLALFNGYRVSDTYRLLLHRCKRMQPSSGSSGSGSGSGSGTSMLGQGATGGASGSAGGAASSASSSTWPSGALGGGGGASSSTSGPGAWPSTNTAPMGSSTAASLLNTSGLSLSAASGLAEALGAPQLSNDESRQLSPPSCLGLNPQQWPSCLMPAGAPAATLTAEETPSTTTAVQLAGEAPAGEAIAVEVVSAPMTDAAPTSGELPLPMPGPSSSDARPAMDVSESSDGAQAGEPAPANARVTSLRIGLLDDHERPPPSPPNNEALADWLESHFENAMMDDNSQLSPAGPAASGAPAGGGAAAAAQQQQQQSTGQGGGEGQRKSGDLSASGVHRLSMLSLFG